MAERAEKKEEHSEMIDSIACVTSNQPRHSNLGSSDTGQSGCFTQCSMAQSGCMTQNGMEGHFLTKSFGTDNIVTTNRNHNYVIQANKVGLLDDTFPESHCNAQTSTTRLLRTNCFNISTHIHRTLAQFLPIKLLELTGSKVLTNRRRDKTVTGWSAWYWVFLLVSWQVTVSVGRPSTQELMHMEARLDVIEQLDSPSTDSEDTRHLFHPEGRDRADWLSCHGQSCEDWNKVQRILTELHLIDLNVRPSSVQNDGPLSNLFLDLISGPAMESAAGNNELTRPWEGTDILLTLEDAEEIYMEVLHKVLGGKRRRKRKINRDENKRWDFPIPYKMDGSHSAHQENMIEQALSLWEKETCVRFKKVDHKTRVEENHLIFTRGQYTCASYVGKMRFGKYNPQPVNLGSSCFEKLGVPVHEIGHALGLWHEHQRPIRDKHIVVDSANIFFWAYNNFMSGSHTHVQDYGVPYDYNSVMHYGATIGSRNGRPTLRPIDSSFKFNMGQREELSFLDTKVVNMAYCEDICGTSTTKKPCQNGGYQDPNNCDTCKCPDGLSGDDCTQVAPSKKAQCGGRHFLSRHGEELHFESPGHSSGMYYMYGTECYWLIETEPQHQLSLRFEGKFNLMCEFDTCSHWVEVKTQEDLSENGPRFCCNHAPTSAITSDSGRMVVIFKSIAETKYESYIGFHAVVTLVTNEVIREDESNGSPDTNNTVNGQRIEPTPSVSTSKSTSHTEVPENVPISTVATTLETKTTKTTDKPVTKQISVKVQGSNRKANRKKKRKPPKGRRKITKTQTENVPTPQVTTDSIVTGTWHVQTQVPERVTNKPSSESTETHKGSNGETNLLTTYTSRESETSAQTEVPETYPTPSVMSQSTHTITEEHTVPTEASKTTENTLSSSSKNKGSKVKSNNARTSFRRRQQKNSKTLSKENVKPDQNRENRKIKETGIAASSVIYTQKPTAPEPLFTETLNTIDEESITTTLKPISHKTTLGAHPVTKKHLKVSTTEVPITVTQENSEVTLKHQSRNGADEASNFDEEGSTFEESSSVTQKTSSVSSSPEAQPTTVKVQATPKRPPKRTFWRTKKPNMKLVLAARRRAARRKFEERKKLLKERPKHEEADKTKEETSDSIQSKVTTNSDKSRHKRIHINSKTNRVDINKDSKMNTGHTKETVTLTSTEIGGRPYIFTFFTYNISSTTQAKPVISKQSAATSNPSIAPTKPNIAPTKPGIAPSKPSIAQSNTIHSTESNDTDTATQAEGDGVTSHHSTSSTSQPVTVQRTDTSTTPSAITESTSGSTTTRQSSTTSGSQKTTTSSTTTMTPSTRSSSTQSSSTLTQTTATSTSSSGDEDRWTEWSSCLGMDCKCGGCSWRIKYKLCGDKPCQGQEMRTERKPCDRVCGAEDTERYWVARFYTRQCKECCGGFVKQGDKCILQEPETTTQENCSGNC